MMSLLSRQSQATRHDRPQVYGPQRQAQHFQHAAETRDGERCGNEIGQHLTTDAQSTAAIEQEKRNPEPGEAVLIDSIESGHDASSDADDHQTDESDSDGVTNGSKVGMREMKPSRLAVGRQPGNQDVLMYRQQHEHGQGDQQPNVSSAEEFQRAIRFGQRTENTPLADQDCDRSRYYEDR